MKPINFITTLSAKQQHALRMWWQFSLGVLGITTLSIIVVQSKQLYTLYTAVRQHNNLHTQASIKRNELEPYNQLKQEETTLRTQRTKIDSIAHATERMSSLLAAVCATDKSVQVQTCTLNKKDFNIIMHTPDAHTALQEVARLRAIKQLDTIKLVSLQQAQQADHMTATVRGAIRKS
jgi:hypothetical protein